MNTRVTRIVRDKAASNPKPVKLSSRWISRQNYWKCKDEWNADSVNVKPFVSGKITSSQLSLQKVPDITVDSSTKNISSLNQQESEKGKKRCQKLQLSKKQEKTSLPDCININQPPGISMFRMLPTAQPFLLLSRHSWAQTETAEYTMELKKINHSCWLDNWREGSCIQLIKGRIKQLCEVSWVLVSFLQTDSQLLAQCSCIWEHGIVWNLNTHRYTHPWFKKTDPQSLSSIYLT